MRKDVILTSACPELYLFRSVRSFFGGTPPINTFLLWLVIVLRRIHKKLSPSLLEGLGLILSN